MRRGHGSTKVPGVKLRPAGPSKSNAAPTDIIATTSADDFDSAQILQVSKKPFHGVVICVSGVTDKVSLFQQAIQLGAKTSSDLTDQVTHLICEASGSKKYEYCVGHNIPIMRPSWIYDSCVKWLNGEDIDLESSMTTHHLPAFASVYLCCTGVGDISKRKEIQKLLVSNGGVFLQKLEKNGQTTHLLCGTDTSNKADERGYTEKMRYAELINKKTEKKVKLVWEEWFWDCLEFKGILNEEAYTIDKPRPKRWEMREATALLAPITSSAEASNRQRSIPPSVPSTILSGSTDVEEVAAVKRVPETTTKLWKGLLKNRGFDMKSGKLSRSPTKSSSSGNGAERDARPSSPPFARLRGEEVETASASAVGSRTSLSTALKRTKSFAASSTALADEARSTLQRVKSTPASTSAGAKKCDSGDLKSSLAPVARDTMVPESEKTLFEGLKFRALGEASGLTLTQAIQSRGGIFAEDPFEEVDFFVVRLASGGSHYRDASEADRPKYRTECWVEHCIYEERLCSADEHLTFQPLEILTPIPGADKLRVHVSGLLMSEKTPSVRLIKAIGATVTEQLSRKNTHLICPSGAGPKFNKAQEWGIPVVDLQWLFQTVKRGNIQGVFDYLVIPGKPSAVVQPPEIKMTDITNNEFVQGSSKSRTADILIDTTKLSFTTKNAQSSSTEESESSLLWKTNGLLTNTLEPPRSSTTSLSPRRSTALNSSNGPSPLSNRRHTAPAEMYVSGPLLGSPFKSAADQSARIPSSTTPSPLKMPSESTAISPSSLKGNRTSDLKDAITSLLGKRSFSDDHDGRVQNSKNGKRSKPPPRSKCNHGGFSRTTSSETLLRSTSEYPLFVPEDSKLVLESDVAEESMRVTYEDPSQQDEKRRLMSLINNEPLEPAITKNGSNLVRRSTRIPGF